ncbi:MAG: AI-2E family transporter [Sphingomonadales bacterium]|nr:AI-2E family transporter [Sphingomonadales bacterium]
MLAVSGLAAAALWTLHFFLHAIGWAAIIAMALWPSYMRLVARWPGQRRLLLPAGAVSLVTLLFVVPLVMVAQAAVQDSAAVMDWVRDAQTNGVPAPDMLANLPYGDHLRGWWTANLSQPGGLGRIATHSQAGSGGVLATGERVVGAVAHRAVLVIFMLVVLFFLLRDGERLGKAMQVATTRAFGAGGEKVFEQVVAAVRGTLNGLVVIGFGEGVLLGVSYELARVPHAALLALLTALLSAIPLGAVVAYVVAAGILAAGGETGWAVGILVWGSIVVFVADHFVRPVLIGGSTRLPFVAVLLGIVGGIEAWGLIGLVLGPALMAALLLLWREFVGEHEGPLAPKVGGWKDRG